MSPNTEQQGSQQSHFVESEKAKPATAIDKPGCLRHRPVERLQLYCTSNFSSLLCRAVQ
jgi:hypothetical protein